MMKYLLALCIVVGGLFFFMQHGSTKELIQYAELEKKLAAQADFVLLDVRTQEEYNEGHIPGAVLLPYDRIAAAAAAALLQRKHLVNLAILMLRILAVSAAGRVSWKNNLL